MRVKSKILRILLPITFLALTDGPLMAKNKLSVVPGLLYSSGPLGLTEKLVPKRLPVAAAVPLATGACGAQGKLGATESGYGPVGISRFMSTQDDPNCSEFWGPDKWRHAAVWFGGSLGVYLFFKTVMKTSKLVAYLLSATVMSLIGVAREISDANSSKNCFSEQDLFANTVGILSAGVVIAIF